MAGAGYKLFNTGDVLTAAQVNTYLQEQVVMVFADATARTTALSGVLAEGMLSYLKDTDAVQYYNGSAWTTINTDQTPLTTKGDLFTYSTADARLAVGSNGDTLLADSAATTGLRWSSQPSASNPVINGAFDVWQRGTSFASPTANQYTADRWYYNSGSLACTISRQTTSDTTNLPNIQYCMRVARNSGQTFTTSIGMASPMESANSIPYAGKTITLSFYARAGANYSPTSSLIGVQLYTGTGTDQNPWTGYTGQAIPINTTQAITTTWTRYSFTATVAATATEMSPAVYMTPTGTAGANDWFEITGVQIDVGNVALPFRRAQNTLAGELAACQRYYWRQSTPNNAYQVVAFGQSRNTTTDLLFVFPAPVPMRIVPTSVDYSTLRAVDGATGYAISALTISSESNNWMLKLDGTSTGLPTFRPMSLSANNSTSAYLGFSAEL